MARNKLSFINKLIFLLNNVFAIALLLSYFFPYIQPKSIPTLATFSLIVPALFFANFIFIIYWVLNGFKKQIFLSSFIIILGVFLSSPLYNFSRNSNQNNDTKKLTVMSYNVRVFNLFNWITNDSITNDIITLIENENPDILAIQEYFKSKKVHINYPHSYMKIKDKNENVGQVIYSKYPIINSGSLDFKNTINNVIYIDIVKNKDTVRIYNLHLESLSIREKEDYFGQKESEKLLNNIKQKFIKQQEQVEQLKKHIDSCNYTIIIAGDMNNTAYSWAYKNIKNNLQDTFLKAGNGFGKTYTFKKIPLRIDYIFVDKSINILNHKNFDQKLSDHYPILATLEL